MNAASHADNETFTAGYLDRLGVWWADRRAAIVELKTGYAEHPQLMAWQLEAQVVAVFQAYPEVDQVVAYGFNPRLLVEWSRSFSREKEFNALLWKIVAVVMRARSGPVFLNPTPEGCAFCRAAAICPAIHREASELAKRPVLDVSSVGTRELFSLLVKARLVKRIEQELAGEARRRAALGDHPDGWELRSTRGNRFVPDPDSAFRRLLEAGLSKESFMDCVEVQVSKLEEAYVEHVKKGGSEETLVAIRKRFEELMRGVVDRAPPSARLIQKGD